MNVVVDELDPVPATVTSKRALLVASHAMERAFDGLSIVGVAGEAGLVVGFFQRREYFDVEADRYASLAAHGHTVIVAFVGPVDGVPPGVVAISLAEDDPRAGDWLLLLVRGGFGSSLIARELHQLSSSEATLEASRLFESVTSLRRHRAISSARSCLEALVGDVPADTLAAAHTHLDASGALPVAPVEEQLAAAADHLLHALEVGHQHAAALRLELQSTTALAERDQLTGLHNRHYLERYLGDEGRPADLLVLLVDVDGLKQVNDTHGHEAGDALLRCVATTLQANTRPGDVVVRWGGDEFLLLVPHLGADAGLRYGGRLATAVGEARADEPWDHLTPSVSIGVTPTRHIPLPMAQLDAALYHVKQHGKGRASLPPVLAGTTSESRPPVEG